MLTVLSSVARPSPPQLCRVRMQAPVADPLYEALLAAGLQDAQAEQVWSRRPPGRLPAARQQARLFEWLQTEVLDSQEPSLLCRCLCKSPRLMLKAGRLGGLEASMLKLRGLLGELSSGHVRKIIVASPALLALSERELEERASWLRSSTGMSEEELAHAIGAEPKLLTVSLEAVKRRLDWFRQRLGISDGRLRRVASRAPLSLLLSVDRTLEARVEYLGSLGLGTPQIATVVVRTPRVLHSPISSLQQKVDWLMHETSLPPTELASWLERQPDYFGLPPARLTDMLATLTDLGMSVGGAKLVLRAEPSVLTQQQEQLRMRAAFFTSILGGTAEELRQVPHMLVCDLTKHVVLRHAFCLSRGLEVSPVDLLVKGTARFCEVAACSEDDLYLFEQEGAHLQFYQGAAL